MIDALDDHVCEWPKHGGWDKFPQEWICPTCGRKWKEDIFNDEDGVYWERA